MNKAFDLLGRYLVRYRPRTGCPDGDFVVVDSISRYKQFLEHYLEIGQDLFIHRVISSSLYIWPVETFRPKGQ